MVYYCSFGYNMEVVVFFKLWGEFYELMVYWCIYDLMVNIKGILIVMVLDFIDFYWERF